MDYNEMLENVYKKLPEKSTSGDRFEKPVFVSFAQGKQTIIKNLFEVASKLRREPEHLIKFLSKELAIPGFIENKSGLLHGSFRNDLLNSRLDKYITEFVLCNECKKPDTNLITFENAKYKRCEVCGARAPVRGI